MVAITIRHVPEAVRDELAARAARSGRSLQEFLSAELAALAARPDPAAVLAAARDRVRLSSKAVATDEILAARDADRR